MEKKREFKTPKPNTEEPKITKSHIPLDNCKHGYTYKAERMLEEIKKKQEGGE